MVINRRQFLKAIGTCTALSFLNSDYALSSDKPNDGLREVSFYKKLQDGVVQCLICPKHCRIVNQGRGYCGNKLNDNGFYYSLVYSRPCAINIDPIEKKPFYHFLPGVQTYSLATAGCNFSCKFCQNWHISQAKPEEIKYFNLSPTDIVEEAKTKKIPVIAFTYGEPIVFYEYMYDIAQLARKHGIHSVMVSNGFINKEPFQKLCAQLSAVKIDLKGFTEEFYQKYCNGSLQAVLDTLLLLKELKIHFEIVVLVIPTLNDNAKEIKEMCRWIKNDLGDDVPVHFSRFCPMYKLTNLPVTAVKTLENIYQTARESGLKFVYLGNVATHYAESTYCPSCQKVLIKRVGYHIEENLLKNSNKCPDCSTIITGIWNIEKK
jgi:pyruvate formate lyase activating enzyme